MKMLFTIVVPFLFNSTFAQHPLPKIKTTYDKSINDLANGISNEDWFFKKTEDKNLYCIIYRNTPVGVRHAFKKYNELRIEYDIVDCNDQSMISSLAFKEDKSYDYEM